MDAKKQLSKLRAQLTQTDLTREALAREISKLEQEQQGRYCELCHVAERYMPETNTVRVEMKNTLGNFTHPPFSLQVELRTDRDVAFCKMCWLKVVAETMGMSVDSGSRHAVDNPRDVDRQVAALVAWKANRGKKRLNNDPLDKSVAMLRNYLALLEAIQARWKARHK
jgi:hypothetical protein